MLTWFAQKAMPGLGWSSGPSLDIGHVLARAGIPAYRQALPLITSEIERARRYKHPLSLALFGIVGAEGAATSQPDSGENRAGLVPAVLASLLRESTREADIVTYAVMLARCLLVMPETDRPSAEAAVQRLGTLACRSLQTPVRASLAVFPTDGLVLEELIRLAATQPVQDVNAQRPGEQPVTAPQPNSALSSA